uniref:Protein CHUP1, chloroplastic-like n=1 Tax=Tanacetum cinerariifolium TaxID=118510 RepID=A0A699SSZ2_TANCI|nr:protein CHUP1, chloroplastic-like [Tanacetum cinerariifolium]
MQEDERKGNVGISSEIESNLCELKDLEAEAEELRKSKNSLTVKKAELLQKLQRDLSKMLSPKSEARAKQLILEYANKEHEGEMRVDIDINIPALDSDQWSSSQNSNLTDSGEIDEPYKKNNKFFGKLVKFLIGKDESAP